jgi:hypothetical protein
VEQPSQWQREYQDFNQTQERLYEERATADAGK